MGKSGATFTFRGDVVDKHGDVNLQSRWLLEHPHSFLPEVLDRDHNCYTMPRYRPLLMTHKNELAVTREVIADLSTLWHEPVQYDFSVVAHLDYLEERVAPNLLSRFRDWLELLEPEFTENECLVHGDPTWENCMLTNCYPSRIIITDPLPPTIGHIPSVRAVDIAKLLQSVMGYEHIVNPEVTTPRMRPADLRVLAEPVEDPEWQLVLYMAALHFQRLWPYSPEYQDSWWRRTVELLDMRDDSWTP